MSQEFTYNVDLVFCIDVTGSMTPLIDNVKRAALSFHGDLSETMKEKGKVIDSLRVQIIAFRDYYCDGDQSFSTSKFFTLPDDAGGLDSFVGGVGATGGGDEPECGLEALSVAIDANWQTGGDRQRQIIVVYTDASAHKLEKDAGSKPSNYPQSMQADFNEITDVWETKLTDSAKRLILFAPDAYPWTDIATHWNNSVHLPSKAGEGLSDVEYQTILDAIANSV